MTTMTIKSFKEHAEINENPFAAAAIGYGAYKAYKVAKKAYKVAKKVAPVVKNYINRKANSFGQTAVIASPLAVPTVAKIGGTGDKATAIPDKMKSALKNPFKNRKPKTNTAYSPVKPSAKGQREEVKLDEKNPPEAHVARSKKNPDMFCVFDKDGKEVKLFKDKKDAEAYAVKNHDELMGESLWANIHKRRKAGKAPKKPGDKGYPKTLDIEATDAETPSMSKLDKPKVSTKDKNTLGKLAKMMSKEKSKKMLKGAKESYGDSITSPKMRALAKADSQPKKPVTLPKAPWEKGTNVTYDKNGRVVKEAAVATMMVTRPGAPNEPIKITATEWPAFKARGYHHAEQKENLNLKENRING